MGYVNITCNAIKWEAFCQVKAHTVRHILSYVSLCCPRVSSGLSSTDAKQTISSYMILYSKSHLKKSSAFIVFLGRSLFWSFSVSVNQNDLISYISKMGSCNKEVFTPLFSVFSHPQNKVSLTSIQWTVHFHGRAFVALFSPFTSFLCVSPLSFFIVGLDVLTGAQVEVKKKPLLQCNAAVSDDIRYMCVTWLCPLVR